MKKRASAQVRIQGQGVGGWEPTNSGIHGRCCRKADGNNLSSRATERDSLIFEGCLKQFSSDPTVWID